MENTRLYAIVIPLLVIVLMLSGCNMSEQVSSDIQATIDASATDFAEMATPDRYESCSTLADKIRTLNISPNNIISPKDTEFPEGSKIIDIYETVEYLDEKNPFLAIEGKSLMCRAKVKIAKGNYPVEFYLITEHKREYIVIESQGKRKWILRWLND